jgi:hypothetical protein
MIEIRAFLFFNEFYTARCKISPYIGIIIALTMGVKALPKKLLPLTLFAAITVAALVLSRPAFAVNIDITENSSTSLTLLYDGQDLTASAVMNTSSDRWTLTFAPTIQWTTFTINGWQEPGGTSIRGQHPR